MNKKSLLSYLLSLTTLIMSTSGVFSWEGYDALTGDQIIVNVENVSSVEQGDFIEYYDVVNKERKTGIIESMNRNGNIINLFVIDDMDGETKHFEMFNE